MNWCLNKKRYLNEKNIFLIIFIFLSGIFLYSFVPQFDLSNESKTLSNREFQIGGKINIKTNPFWITYSDIVNSDEYTIFFYYGSIHKYNGHLYTNTTAIYDPFVPFPVLSFESNGRFGLKNDFEAGFNFGTTPPYLFMMALTGPDIIFDFNLKK